MRLQKLLPLAALFVSAFPIASYAGIQVSGQAAADFNSDNYGFASSPSLLLGGDLTFGVSDLFQIGGTYQHNVLSYENGGGSGSTNFYGGLVRIGTFSPLFGDAQAGLVERDGSGTSFSWGLGAGYKIPISYFIDLSPRIGYRSVPDSGVTRSLFDAGFLITFTFL